MLRLFLAFALLCVTTPTMAGYQKLVVLGDSLSDMGNAHLISGGAFPGTPSGRASNGPVAAEYLAAGLGIADFAPAQAGGTNHAVVGATTDTRNYNFEINSPAGVNGITGLQASGMSAQLGAVQTGAPYDPASTLFMVWGGANDVFLGLAQGLDLNAVAATAAGNLVGIVSGLIGVGAQHLLVMGLPNLGITPEAIDAGPLAQASFTALAQGFNLGLSQALDQIEALSGADIRFFDAVTALGDLATRPADFGLTNIEDRCIDSPAALAANCAGYAFFDSVHPTTAVHQIIGQRMLALVAEPAVLTLALPLILAVAWFRPGRLASH